LSIDPRDTFAWFNLGKRGGGEIDGQWYSEKECYEKEGAILSSVIEKEGRSAGPRLYQGPILPSDSQILAQAALADLGIEIAIAPSTMASAGLGLFIRPSSTGIGNVTIPGRTLICDYSRSGSFSSSVIDDRAVEFTIPSSDTLVLYEQRLMSVVEALALASQATEDGNCGLFGHDLQVCNDGADKLRISPSEDGFPSFFEPEKMNDEQTLKNIFLNFGQFCNDLVWDFTNPPSEEEYTRQSKTKNIIRLAWRLEYDKDLNCLKPRVPVMVVTEDVKLINQNDFMELGLKYGWKYWQAIADWQKV